MQRPIRAPPADTAAVDFIPKPLPEIAMLPMQVEVLSSEIASSLSPGHGILLASLTQLSVCAQCKPHLRAQCRSNCVHLVDGEQSMQIQNETIGFNRHTSLLADFSNSCLPSDLSKSRGWRFQECLTPRYKCSPNFATAPIHVCRRMLHNHWLPCFKNQV